MVARPAGPELQKSTKPLRGALGMTVGFGLWLLVAAAVRAQAPAADPGVLLEEAARSLRRGDLEGGLARVEEGLAAGYPTPFDVMARTAFRPLRHDPEARRRVAELLRRFARESRVTIVTPEQLGERMQISGRLIDAESGAPVTEALVYVFHTTAEGLYAPESPQGGRLANNPYLFAYLRPDAKGRFEIHTVRPSPYAGFERPNLRHVHYQVEAPGYGAVNAQFYLDRDPEPTPERRRAATERGFPILTAEPQGGVGYLLELTLELHRRRR